MAGDIIGRVDMRMVAPAADEDHQQQHFVAIKKFFDQMVTAGHCTIHASNYGSGGTGFDYYDESNPAGENAFFVVSFDDAATPFYVLVQWANDNAFGNSPGNPGRMNGSTSIDGVGFTVAFREDGGDPWNGDSDADGTDNKGATVWTAGGSTLHVLDLSNSPGGTYATNKENMQELVADAGLTTSRMHIVGDADGFFLAHDNNDDGSYRAAYAGAYTPLSGVTVAHPYVMVTNAGGANGFWATTSDFGTTTGNGADEGAVMGKDDDVQTVRMRTSDLLASAWQPNNQRDTVAHDGSAIHLVARDNNPGWVGYIPTALVSVNVNAPSHQTNAAATLAYIGSATQSDEKWAIAWDTGNPPGTINDRDGREFTVTP